VLRLMQQIINERIDSSKITK